MSGDGVEAELAVHCVRSQFRFDIISADGRKKANRLVIGGVQLLKATYRQRTSDSLFAPFCTYSYLRDFANLIPTPAQVDSGDFTSIPGDNAEFGITVPDMGNKLRR